MLIWCAIYLADVPEGSFIVRAHTPISNLFSCLWFNEVDRFTSRDQLSFAYTYLKLRRMNPDRPFYLNMFKVLAILRNLWHIFLLVVRSYYCFMLHAICDHWMKYLVSTSICDLIVQVESKFVISVNVNLSLVALIVLCYTFFRTVSAEHWQSYSGTGQSCLLHLLLD